MATRPRGETQGRIAALCLLLAFILVMGASLPSLAQRPDAVAKMKEAATEQQKGNDVGALGLLEEAIKTDPNWFAPRIVDAQIRLGLKQYPEAIKHLETVLLTKGYRFPADKAPEYWVLLGKCRFEAEMEKPEADRKFDGTMAAFEKATSIDKKLHEPSYYMARIAYAKNDIPKAGEYVKAALDAQPGNPQYLVLQADIRYRQGDIEGASTALNEVLEKLAGMKESREYGEATALQKRINADLSGRKWKKIALIGGPILLVVIVVVALVLMRGRQAGSVMLDGDMGTEGGTYEEICVAALRRLSALTQMAHGVVYITTMDGDGMIPKATLALEPEEVKPMPVDINEIPRWVERNDGKPFLFKSEKKEGTFIKAYPEVRELLEPLQIRIGVPFLFQDRVLGMAFLGMEESKDILRFKKLYERSQGDIYRLAMEYAAALHRLYEDELAYVDVLTKFKSRRYVDENLPRAMVDAEDNGRKGAIVMFEFDQFRGLQEQYGDPQAEAVLKTVAAEVKLAIPAEDGMVARFEGGKFFAFAPVKDAAEAMKLGERIKARVTETRISRNFPSPSASVGVAVFPDNGKKADDLIWAADRVMMGLSAGGGNAIGAVDGAAPPQGPSRTAAPTAPAAPTPPASAPPAEVAAAPRPFMGGAAPPPAATSAPPPPPTPFVPGFSGGPLKPNAPATGFSPNSIPTSAEPPKAAGIPGFSGAGPAAPPALPKAGGIPGFPGAAPAAPAAPPKAGGIPGFPGAAPAAPAAPPKAGGIPGFSGAGPAAPPSPPKAGGIPGFSGAGPAEPPAATPPPPPPPAAPESPVDDGASSFAPKSSSAGLTRKGTGKSDAGGMKAKGPASGPGAGKSTLGGSGRPMFPSGAARPTLSSSASPEEAPDEAPEPAAAAPPMAPDVAAPPAAPKPAFPGAPAAPTAPAAAKPAFPGAPATFPGAPAAAPAAPAAAKPAFPGAPPAFPGAPAAPAAPAAAKPAFPGAPSAFPGAPAAPTAPAAAKPAFPGAPSAFPGAPPPAAATPPPAFPGAPSAFPGSPPAFPGAPAAAAAATPPPAFPGAPGAPAAPAAPPAFPGAAPRSPVAPAPSRGNEEFRTRPATPSTPSWLQAEIEANPPAAAPPTQKSGLLGGKGGGGGKLFRRAGAEGGDAPAAAAAPAPAPAPAAAAPEPWPISPSDRDATGFVNAELLGSALGREIERAQTLRDACTVLYLHLDQHDDIAGRLGEERLTGIKNEIASLINDFLKEGTDIPGHYDNGLVIVLPRTASRIACNLAEQIRFTVSHLSFPDLNGNSTLSIGVAACPEHGNETSALLQAAVTAAGQASGEGGNTIKVYGS